MLIAVSQSVKSVTVKPVTRGSRSAQRRAHSSSPDPGLTTETSGKSCAKKRESFVNSHTHTHTHTLECSLFGVVKTQWKNNISPVQWKNDIIQHFMD